MASFFSVPCSWPETARCCFQFYSFPPVPDCFPCSSYIKTSLLIQGCGSCCVLKPTLPCGSLVSPLAVSVQGVLSTSARTSADLYSQVFSDYTKTLPPSLLPKSILSTGLSVIRPHRTFQIRKYSLVCSYVGRPKRSREDTIMFITAFSVPAEKGHKGGTDQIKIE